MSEESAAVPGKPVVPPLAELIPLPVDEPREDYADGRRRKLAPAYVPAARLTNWIVTAFLATGGIIGFPVLFFAVDWPAWGVWSGCAAIVVFLGVSAWTSHYWPPLEFKRTSWRLDARGLEIKRGVVWRHVIVVPRTRIQHTDVSQGPVQRRFDIATLVIHTAGTHQYEVTLAGLSRATAFAVRDALLGEGREDGA